VRKSSTGDPLVPLYTQIRYSQYLALKVLVDKKVFPSMAEAIRKAIDLLLEKYKEEMVK